MPLGKLVVVMLRAVVAAAAMLIVMAWVAVWRVAEESVTLTVKLNCPAELGVPLMIPEVLSDRPAGKAPEAKAQL